MNELIISVCLFYPNSAVEPSLASHWPPFALRLLCRTFLIILKWKKKVAAYLFCVNFTRNDYLKKRGWWRNDCLSTKINCSSLLFVICVAVQGQYFFVLLEGRGCTKKQVCGTLRWKWNGRKIYSYRWECLW